MEPYNMRKKEKDDLHTFASQKEVQLYMEANGLSLGSNKICTFPIREVICELDGAKVFRKEFVEGCIDENSFMHLDIYEAWNANDAPTNYRYDFQTFKYYPSVGLVVTGNHPIHGNYKTTIYNK